MQSFLRVQMLFLCLVYQFVFVIVHAAVVFQDCGSAYDLRTVNIEGCGKRLPCFVTLGDRIPVNVRFYADFVSRQLDQDVTIRINFVHARTPVTPEPCETVMCPVRTDAATSFTSIMSVPTNMALNQRGHLQWRVYNEVGQQVLCYQVMVQTQTFLQKSIRRYLAVLDASQVFLHRVLRRYLVYLDTRTEPLESPLAGNTFSDRFLNSTAHYSSDDRNRTTNKNY